MENINNRYCDYLKDKQRLMEFWLETRVASDVRRYPTIWRLRLLLTSRVWEPEKDSRIWENASGHIIGFAMLWRRHPTSPYLVLDSFAHPAYASENLFLKILQWGIQRVHEIVKEQKIPITIYANGFSRYDFAESILTRFDFALILPNPDEHNVYFSRTLHEKILSPSLPQGYGIRYLQGMDDLESYQGLYGFAKVNLHHQRELIESNEYCHLVVTGPGDELAAYCECSVCLAEWERTNQRVGWIDYIGTSSDQQRKGLGKAALLEGLAHLQRWGADTAMLVTINTNVPAVNLYHKTGFEKVDVLEYPGYQKQIQVQS